MTAALRFRVVKERNVHGSMEMSFFISCPLNNAVPGPDKSGHRAPYCIIVKPALHMCPDLRGTLKPPVKGHDIKKDIFILFSIFSFSGVIDPRFIHERNFILSSEMSFLWYALIDAEEWP